jgi:hypothetical protein
MLLLIFLFGSCIINAVSRFISQQVQWIKLQLLVKEYSPLPTSKHSIPFYQGHLETTWINASDKYHHPIPLSPHCQHEEARWVIAPFPNSRWVLVSEGRLFWVWRPKADGGMSALHPPMESTVIAPSWEGVVSLHFCTLKRRYRVW